MKIAFLGATSFSCDLLLHLISEDLKPGLVFGIPEEFTISYAERPVRNYNYGNLRKIADEHIIPFRIVDGTDGRRLQDYEDAIAAYEPDVILVMGWYYKIPARIRALARHGAWGIHASLLPDYAGGAPLVWAIINGETETGVTLFQLDDGTDSGDIVAQASLAIGPDDTIASVYAGATAISRELLSNALRSIDSITPRRQDMARRRLFPQRTPNDGELDLTWPAVRIHNFVRAQSNPYPGAFIRTTDGKKLVIEKTRIADAEE